MAGRNIDLLSIFRKILGLTVGAVIYSAGLNLFLIPNHIIDGGITGISLLVQALTGIPFSLLIVILNLPFFYLGYRRLGAGLAASSTYAIVVLSLCSSWFEQLKPATTDPFLSTIFGGIIIGIGVGIVIKSGGSTDGTEIVAIWMDNRTSFSVGGNHYVLQFLHPGRCRFCVQLEQRHVFPHCLFHLLPHD